MTGLPYGRTLAEVQRAAQFAARHTCVDVLSYAGRYDEAWSAVVALLYASPHPPADSALVQAGREGLYALIREHRHHHGHSHRAADRGPGTAPSFQRYWQTAYTPSPEGRVVERQALRQILPKLSPRQREVVYALAVADGDPTLAAERLGLSRDTFVSILNEARRRFRLWWHEGEAPSGMWQRGYRRPCGEATEAGGERCRAGHVRSPENTYVAPDGTRMCRPCRADAAQRGRRRQAGARRSTAVTS